jgi:beta-N-acetylhexosaminidase
MRLIVSRAAAGLLLAGTIALVVLSCSGPRAEIPATEPAIAGAITEVDQDGEHRGSIRVEGLPGGPAGSDQAVVRIEQGTVLLDADGRKAGFSALKTGRRVRVWFTGPVRESYPVQADAATVVIERMP